MLPTYRPARHTAPVPERARRLACAARLCALGVAMAMAAAPRPGRAQDPTPAGNPTPDARPSDAGARDAGARPDGSRAGPCEAAEAQSGERQYRGFACERRALTLSTRPAVGVDAGPNGGVSARGDTAARQPAVTAVVTAYAPTDAEAARLAAGVQLVDEGGTLVARGPARRYDDRGRGTWWSVDWRLAVPRRTDLDLRAVNGGLAVADVVGRLRLETRNGGVALARVGGDVRGRATNGGVAATLGGAAWDAAGYAQGGLDLASDNGGAVLRVPASYAARVRVESRNGPLAVDFPVPVSGALRGNALDVTLGAGGAPVRVASGNGGARLARVP